MAESMKGTISIHAQNIMPIIKKWLYSDKDIFLREVISNASDAITKRRLAEPEFMDGGKITVTVDEANGELRVTDNGIGMTADEVEKYINQVAFSSAEEFLKQYEGADGIIGHFGLGFYSTFMVSKKVVIDTLSYSGGKAVRWESEDGLSFEMTDSDKAEIGTTITLVIADDEREFLEKNRVRDVLTKYCAFMATPIFLTDTKDGEETADASDVDEDMSDEELEKLQEELAKAQELDGDTCECGHDHDHEHTCECGHDHDHEHTCECGHDHHHDEEHKDELEAASDKNVSEKKEKPAPTPINNTRPLWLKDPKDATDEEYKSFYYKVFHEYEEPLFWVHLNVDHPFRLKGILYFPKLKQDMTRITEGPIKLFSGQVFVADNIKEVIPEFLTLLKGVIDCPDIPLNVSRSFLQNDNYVKKLSAYITRKVADRLTSLFNKDREAYEKYWTDINPFVKFGCMKDESFFDKVKDIIIFKLAGGGYVTRAEYLEKYKEKTDKKIFYATDEKIQTPTIAMYTDQDIGVVLLDSPIDANFLSFLEYKDSEVKYSRVDSDLTGLTNKDDTNNLDSVRLETLFRDALGKKELKVSVESFKDEHVPAITLEDEHMRRYRDMSRMFGQSTSPFPADVKLVLNSRSDIIRHLNVADATDVNLDIARHVYDLAEMAREPLDTDALREFVARSYNIIERGLVK